MPREVRRFVFGVLLLAGTVLAGSAGFAAEDEKPPGVVLVPVREQPRILASDQPVVMTTRQELDALLRAAYPEAGGHFPRAAAVQSGRFEADVESEGMRIAGELAVRGLAERGWVDLSAEGIVCLRIAVDGVVAPVMTDGERRFVEVGRGDHVIELEGLVAVERAAGVSRAQLGLPRAAALELALRVLGSAALTCDAPIEFSYDAATGVTSGRIAPEGGKAFHLAWREPTPEDVRAGMVTCLSVNDVLASGSSFEVRAALSVQVRLAARERLSVALPEGFTATGVKCEALRRYSLVEEDGGRRLVIELMQSVLGAVDLEIDGTFARGGTLTRIMPIGLADAWQTWGTLELRPAPGLLLALGEDQGMERVPTEMDRAAFSFSRPDCFVEAGAREAGARLSVDLNAALAVSAGQTLAVADAAFEVIDGLAFEVTAIVPERFAVVEEALIIGEARSEQYAEEVRDGERRLTWRLAAPLAAGDKGRLALQLSHTHGAEGEEAAFELPGIRLEAAEELHGLYALACDPAFRVNVSSATWAQAIPHAQLLAEGKVPPGTQAVLRLLSPDYAAKLKLVRLRPVTWVSGEVTVEVLRNLVRERTRLVYHTEEGPVTELRFSLPAQEEARPRITVSEPVTSLEETERREGRSYYAAELSEALLGSVAVEITREHALGSEGQELAIEAPRSEGTIRESGEIWVATEGAQEVEMRPEALTREEIASSEQLSAGGQRVIERYRYAAHPWRLGVRTRLRPRAEVLALLVDRVDSTFIYESSGSLIADESLALRSRGSQAVSFGLPEGDRLWAVLVNGRPANATRTGDSLTLSLPRGQSDWGAYSIRIVRETREPSGRSLSRMTLEPVGLPDGVPVGTTETHVYLSDDMELAWSEPQLPAARPRALLAGPVLRVVGRLLLPLGGMSMGARIVFGLIVTLAWGLYVYFRRTGRTVSRAIGTTAALLLVGIFLVGLLSPALSRAREEARSTQSRSNLRQIGLGMTMFGRDNAGSGPQDIKQVFERGYLTQKGSSVLWNPRTLNERVGDETNYILRKEVADGTLRLDAGTAEPIIWEDPTDEFIRSTDTLNVLYSDGSVRTFSGLSQLNQPRPDAVQWPELVMALRQIYAQEGDELLLGEAKEEDKALSYSRRLSRLSGPAGRVGQRDGWGSSARLEGADVVLKDGSVMVRERGALVSRGPTETEEMIAGFRFRSLIPEEGKLSIPLVIERVGRHYRAQTPGRAVPFGMTLASSSVVEAGAWVLGALALAVGFALGRASKAAGLGVALAIAGAAHGGAALLGDVLTPAANGALAGVMVLALLYLLSALGRGLKRSRMAKASATAVLILIAACLLSSVASGQEGAAPDQAKDPLAALIERLAPSGPVTLSEDAVYVPYSLGQTGEVVPLDRCYLVESLYRQLRARSAGQEHTDERDWLYGSADYAARVQDGALLLTGDMELEAYKETGVVPVAMQGVRMEEVAIEGPKDSTASLAPDGRLAVNRPGRYRLRIRAIADKPVRTEAGELAVALPEFPAGRLTLTIPSADEKLEFEVGPGGRPYMIRRRPGVTDLVVAVGGGGPLRVAWRLGAATPREEKLMTGAVHALALIEADAVTTLSRADLSLPVGSTHRVTLVLPTQAMVVQVVSDDLRTWRVVETEDRQTVEISYNREWSGQRAVFVGVWRRRQPDEEKVDAARDAPRAAGVARFAGTLAVAAAPDVEGAFLSSADLAFLATKDIDTLRGEAWEPLAGGWYEKRLLSFLGSSEVRAFAISGESPSAVFSVRRAGRPLRVECATDLVLEPDYVRLHAAVRAEREKGRLFRLDLSVPEGLRLAKVTGERLGRWEFDDETKRLILYPDAPTNSLTVELEGRLSLPRDETFPLPAVRCAAADRQQALIRVRGEAGMEPAVQELKGLKPAGEQADTEVEWTHVYRADGPEWSAMLKVSRPSPSVLCDTWIEFELRETEYAYAARLNFTVQRAPIDRVSFSVPLALATGLSVKGPMRETIRTALADRLVYELVLERPMTGAFTVEVAAADALGGESVSVPELVVHDVERRVTHLAVVSRLAAQVAAEKLAGLEAVEADRSAGLPDWIDARAIALLYRAEDRWELALTLERYVKEKGLEIFVDRAALTTMLDGQRAITHASFAVYNRTAQMLTVALPAGATLWGASVAGRPVAAGVAEDAGSYRIPLLKVTGEEERFGVDILYAAPLPAGGEAEMMPATPVDLPVSKTDWELVLPKALRAKVKTNMRRSEPREEPKRQLLSSLETPAAAQQAEERPYVSQGPYGQQVKTKAKQAVLDQQGFIDWFQQNALQQAAAPKAKSEEEAPAEEPARVQAVVPEDDVAYVVRAMSPTGGTERLSYTIAGGKPWIRLSVAPRRDYSWAAQAAPAVCALLIGLFLLTGRASLRSAAVGEWIASQWRWWAFAAVLCIVFALVIPFVVFLLAALLGYVRERATRKSVA